MQIVIRRQCMKLRAQTILVVAFCLVPSLAYAQPDDPPTGEEPEEPQPVVVAPELIEFVEAEYPETATEQGLEATVELALTISAEGAVTAAEVVDEVGSGFDEAAVAAALRFQIQSGLIQLLDQGPLVRLNHV